MLNPRLQNLVRRNADHLYFAPGKLRIPFKPDEAAAVEKLNSLLAKWDRANGRELSQAELVRGVPHAEDRSIRERVEQDGTVTTQPEPFTGNPYQRMLDDGPPMAHTRETREQMLTRRAADWNNRKREQEAENERLADPKRVKAMDHSALTYLDTLYDPSAGMSDIRAAEKRVSVARDGDLTEYRQLDGEYRSRQQSKMDERLSSIDGQMSSLRARRAEVTSGGFDPGEDANGPQS